MKEADRPGTPAPPVAEARPSSYTVHGITVEDPYRWLKDDGFPKVEDEAVLAYLNAEYAYFEAVMAPRRELVETLYAELKAREQPDDADVPIKDGRFYYQARFEEGGQYRIWSRWPAQDAGAEYGPTSAASVILDEPALATGVPFLQLGACAVSNDARLLAYSTDTSGAERFTLRVKDLDTGKLLDDVIHDTQGRIVWAADDSVLFYTVVDEHGRAFQVRRHAVGEPEAYDQVVYEEADARFFVGVSATASKDYVVIHSRDHETTEVYLIPAAEPFREPRVVSARRTGHEYHVDHQGDRFVIKTNDTHKNARLVTAPDDDPSESGWRTLAAGSDERYIRAFAAFADFIVVQERLDGLDQIRLIDRAGTSSWVGFPESSYSVEIGANKEFQARTVRLHYTSLVTPNTVFDCGLATGALRERKVQRIPGGYDPPSYVTERAMAPARDGVRVPVSIVYRKGTPRDGTAPLYLYGYGAYGNAATPFFSTSRLSLLDRGMVFAIAHVRGGDELGRHWYESGKLDRRTNTFNDFVDVARYLVAEGLTAPGRIAISGGSAGGELVGAAVNQAPGLWGVAVARVPFVDVLNTMLDTSLALTPSEWSEWGNPIEDKEAFELIRSYSPYDQLKAGIYPAMFVTGSLHDWRVTYWEPAKYVAKLRTLKEDDNPLVLKTNMDAGHGGNSGRFDSLYEVAEEYAFVLWALGLADGG